MIATSRYYVSTRDSFCRECSKLITRQSNALIKRESWEVSGYGAQCVSNFAMMCVHIIRVSKLAVNLFQIH